ncbi:MAG: hypothetical protein HKM05_10280 [Spirochaetales bacterium]|nr:hypothetical protein [Spirochaetales bacterium]
MHDLGAITPSGDEALLLDADVALAKTSLAKTGSKIAKDLEKTTEKIGKAAGDTEKSLAGPYAHLKDPKGVAPGKPFTPAQKRAFLAQNSKNNNGVLRDDVTGEELVPSA